MFTDLVLRDRGADVPVLLIEVDRENVECAQLLGRGHPELEQRGDHGMVDLGRRSRKALPPKAGGVARGKGPTGCA
ncbi:hypothetical protein ACFVUY_24515 [Kitasatospora sp. NPDC058063]|uniref:hypothetical protein n=1 Tax=unclassified Kitasatospora TaxID=2633591 RepID=UPI0036DEEBDF